MREGDKAVFRTDAHDSSLRRLRQLAQRQHQSGVLRPQELLHRDAEQAQAERGAQPLATGGGGGAPRALREYGHGSGRCHLHLEKKRGGRGEGREMYAVVRSWRGRKGGRESC